MKCKYGLVYCGVLVALVVYICVQVEVHNYLAGGVLPNREGGKLRYSVQKFIEPDWRKRHGYDDPSLLQGRELTTQEQTQIANEKFTAHHRNWVTSCTRSWGLLQYILAPAACLWSVSLLLFRKGFAPRMAALLMSLLSLISLYLLLYRGYFND